MEDARDCARASMQRHVIVGGLMSPVHASYAFKQKASAATSPILFCLSVRLQSLCF
jgi:hypothetical protein